MTSTLLGAGVPVAGSPSGPAQDPPTAVHAAVDWDAEIEAACTDASRLELVFQPIVDLQRATIAGYETLSRFTDGHGGRSAYPPDVWFAQAEARGSGARLEAVVVRRVLELLPDLPPSCFLTVNVSPHLLTEPELADLLLAADDLSPLVLELTEHQAVADLRPLVQLRDQLMARGALVALDDAGSGYSGLQQITQFRPQMIKLDRGLVADADKDEVKLALAELLGAFGERIDAWLLAEGIETWGELAAFLRLGVPLGQGYLLGRPAPGWSELDPELVTRLRGLATRTSLVENVVSLVEVVPVLPPGADLRTLGAAETGLRVDAHGRPEAVLLPVPGATGHRAVPVSLRAIESTDVGAVARRVVARPVAVRHDPVVCTDTAGVAVGIVRVESLLLRLAQLADHRTTRTDPTAVAAPSPAMPLPAPRVPR